MAKKRGNNHIDLVDFFYNLTPSNGVVDESRIIPNKWVFIFNFNLTNCTGQFDAILFIFKHMSTIGNIILSNRN